MFQTQNVTAETVTRGWSASPDVMVSVPGSRPMENDSVRWPHGYPLGGAEYIRLLPGVAWPYIVVAVVASVIGTLGNVCVLGIIAFNKTMRNARNAFLVNLGVADLAVTSIATPYGVVGMVYGKDYFVDRPILCDFVATVCLTACVTALFSIGGISFNRYFNICHLNLYQRIFNIRTNIFLCACFWLVGILMSLPGLVGWTDNVYDHKYLECIWNRLHNLSYTIFFSSCVVGVPVATISYSFIRIFMHVRASKRRIASEVKSNDQQKNTKGDASVKLARTLFVIFAVFVICWTPYAVLVLVDWHDRLPHELHLYILLLAHMHATLNPIVYATTNVHFRQGFQQIFAVLPGCGGRRHPLVEVSAVSATTEVK